MTNLTIKKSDGTTDILWTNVVTSSGDRSPSIYRSNTVGGNLSVRPELRVTSRDSGDNLTRRMTGDFYYPESAMVDGREQVINKLVGSITIALPKAMAVAVTDEAVSQFINLLSNGSMRTAFKSGYAERT